MEIYMTDQTLKNTFQIQPVYALRDQWEALASQEGLFMKSWSCLCRGA